MNAKHLMWCALAAFLIGIGHSTASVQAQTPKASINRFLSAVAPQDATSHTPSRREQSKRMAMSFERYLSRFFEGERISALDDDDLSKLFDATDFTSFHEGSPKRARQLVELALEKERRHQLSERDLRAAFGALLQARLFVSASVLRGAHSSLAADAIPDVRDASDGQSPSWFEYAEGTSGSAGARLTRLAAPSVSEWRIVVVAHPRCHFTQAAALAISANNQLKKLFAAHSIWVMPPDRRLDLDAMREWNEEYPELKVKLAYSIEDWPLIGDWDTPTFYFLKNGRIVDKVTGWPKNGHLTELTSAAVGLGLNPASHTPKFETPRAK